MMRAEFEMLPSGWQVDAEEFEQVIEPCYMYLPEELIGTTQKEFSAWLSVNGITDTNGLKYPWMVIVREMRKDFELMQADKETIAGLRTKVTDLSEAVETFTRYIQALMKEKAELQDEVLALTKAVGEMGLYISDEQIVQMVNDAGRLDFFIWCNGRVKE